MEKKAAIHFEVKKEDRLYTFCAPMGAPFGETHDVLYEIIKEVLSMAQERTEKEENKVEEPAS